MIQKALALAPDDGSEDLFAHFSAIGTSGFNTLQERQKSNV
jgi:CspA family cold shock protein